MARKRKCGVWGEGKKKTWKWELWGRKEKLQGGGNWQGKEEGKRQKRAPEKVKSEERNMDMDMDVKKKMKQTFKMKREARTSSEQGEIECSLFEWLLDSSLWLSFLLFRFDCARAYCCIDLGGGLTEKSMESFKV